MGWEVSPHCVQLRAGNGKAAFDVGDVFTNPEAAAKVMIKYAYNALSPGRMFSLTGHLAENLRNKGPVGAQTGPTKPGDSFYTTVNCICYCKLWGLTSPIDRLYDIPLTALNETPLTAASPSILEHHPYVHHSRLIFICASLFPVLSSSFQLWFASGLA